MLVCMGPYYVFMGHASIIIGSNNEFILNKCNFLTILVYIYNEIKLL